jgi:hypothetical protein
LLNRIVESISKLRLNSETFPGVFDDTTAVDSSHVKII